MKNESRRKFVKKLTYFMSALFVLPLFFSVKKIAIANSKDIMAQIAQDFFASREEVRGVAEAYLEKHVHDRESLSEDFLKDIKLEPKTLSMVSFEDFRERLADKIRKDHQTHELLLLNHWFVAKTEAKFYTCAFLAMPS